MAFTSSTGYGMDIDLICKWCEIDVFFISHGCISYLLSIWYGSDLDGTSHYRMNLEFAISDIYQSGLKNSKLQFFYEGNKGIHMSVNTPDGLTQISEIENCVLQGDTFRSILASVQVDSIGKECAESDYGYKYQNILPIGMLGLVDDT